MLNRKGISFSPDIAARAQLMGELASDSAARTATVFLELVNTSGELARIDEISLRHDGGVDVVRIGMDLRDMAFVDVDLADVRWKVHEVTVSYRLGGKPRNDSLPIGQPWAVWGSIFITGDVITPLGWLVASG